MADPVMLSVEPVQVAGAGTARGRHRGKAAHAAFAGLLSEAAPAKTRSAHTTTPQQARTASAEGRTAHSDVEADATDTPVEQRPRKRSAVEDLVVSQQTAPISAVTRTTRVVTTSAANSPATSAPHGDRPVSAPAASGVARAKDSLSPAADRVASQPEATTASAGPPGPPAATNAQPARTAARRPSGRAEEREAPARSAERGSAEPEAPSGKRAERTERRNEPVAERVTTTRAEPQAAPHTSRSKTADVQITALPADVITAQPTVTATPVAPQPAVMQASLLIERAVADRRPTAELTLSPESLGNIQVQLTVDASGSLSATVTAQVDATAQLLNSAVNDLRASLEAAGLDVAQLDVRAGADDRRDSQYDHQDAADAALQGQLRRFNVAAAASEAGEMMPAAVSRPAVRGGRNLDLLA